jgi:hypothetical protein
MRKLQHLPVVICLTLAGGGVAVGQVDIPRVPVSPVLPAREVDVASIKELIASTETIHQTSVFIGGPLWSVDGTVKPKAGAHFLDNDAIITIDDGEATTK